LIWISLRQLWELVKNDSALFYGIFLQDTLTILRTTSRSSSWFLFLYPCLNLLRLHWQRRFLLEILHIILVLCFETVDIAFIFFFSSLFIQYTFSGIPNLIWRYIMIKWTSWGFVSLAIFNFKFSGVWRQVFRALVILFMKWRWITKLIMAAFLMLLSWTCIVSLFHSSCEWWRKG